MKNEFSSWARCLRLVHAASNLRIITIVPSLVHVLCERCKPQKGVVHDCANEAKSFSSANKTAWIPGARQWKDVYNKFGVRNWPSQVGRLGRSCLTVLITKSPWSDSPFAAESTRHVHELWKNPWKLFNKYWRAVSLPCVNCDSFTSTTTKSLETEHDSGPFVCQRVTLSSCSFNWIDCQKCIVPCTQVHNWSTACYSTFNRQHMQANPALHQNLWNGEQEHRSVLKTCNLHEPCKYLCSCVFETRDRWVESCFTWLETQKPRWRLIQKKPPKPGGRMGASILQPHACLQQVILL